jgi:RNA polymerase sigma-70 factor (ECF subfamily)
MIDPGMRALKDNSMTTDPLDALLERLCSGDVSAAEQVFLAYEPILRKVVRRRLPPPLRCKFDSVDIVQSIWADLLQGFRDAGWRFTSAAHLRAFLIKVTRNRFIDRYRTHLTALEREQPLTSSVIDGSPRAPSPEPSEVAQANDLWDQMLRYCPPPHRELLRLRRQGLSMAEVAAHSGLHEDSVRRILRDIARQLARRQQSDTASPEPEA